MLRHVIFVFVLVGAAFAGGAAINGPGLVWLQHNLIGGPTVIVDAEASGGASKSPKRFPSAPMPPLFVVPPPRPAASKAVAADPASPADDPTGADLAKAATPPPSENNDGSLAFAPPLDLPSDTSAAAAVPGSASAPPLDAPAKADPVARQASAGGLDPASAPASPGTGRDWADVRRRLKALGASRYSIEAETDGRVRFSCVIPVDGLRAVGHHFEAEGDDEFQAAEATIRRITLWRATEPGRADP